ncbi:MAG TPA: alkaline phosphatase PhoX [Blastocatellia bacterium]|nr:alkaline phosphatase PhoX [Blastocatellia bacterium]
MSKLDRRAFLSRSAIGGGMALAMHELIGRQAFAREKGDSLEARRKEGGYGDLAPTLPESSSEPMPAALAALQGVPLLALPPGFKYTVFGATGKLMSDGEPTPGAHDGMASFSIDGRIRLVRNHEIRNTVPTTTPVPSQTIGDPDAAYDMLGGGGTTTLVIDPEARLPERDFVSLAGSIVNCAGGPTPWGSWITCEETVLGEIRLPNGRGGYSRDHGYCFEVSASANGQATPVALRAMGRFSHEAVAVDPATGIVYETEDANPSGLYRYIPNQPANLAAGGRLQMLAIKDRPNYDTRAGQRVGKPLPVTWVDIANPDPPEAETVSFAVYQQGEAQGGAAFARLEGAWYANGSIYFISTSGGDLGLGQVWEYRPRGNSGGQLILLYESEGVSFLDSPDNITVSPRGGFVLCEDGDEEQFLRGLTQDGKIFNFARNIVPGFDDQEFAGATFSPDGETLFVNIQTPGLTFAIWGPWEDGAL